MNRFNQINSYNNVGRVVACDGVKINGDGMKIATKYRCLRKLLNEQEQLDGVCHTSGGKFAGRA